MQLLALTNNPAVRDSEKISCEVLFLNGSPLDVLNRAEELLQRNARLLSAPLPPNVPTMRGPYRTIFLEKNCSKQYDAAGLISVAKARKRYEAARKVAVYEEDPDFADIDLSFAIRVLRDIATCI